MASILATTKVSNEKLTIVKEDLLELALRKVAAEHSERPMYFVFPALRISSRAGIDSSRGVSWETSQRNEYQARQSRPTRINAMQVVEIGSEAESLNGTLDVLLDVGGRVGHWSISALL